MPYLSPAERADLLEAISRNSHARRIVNLAAVGRATLAASRDGDPDPLAFLRAELTAQGFSEERQDQDRSGA